MYVRNMVRDELSLTHVTSVHLDRLGYLSEDTVRFYVAEIGSALAFLHDKRIIHRYVGKLRVRLSLALFRCVQRLEAR